MGAVSDSDLNDFILTFLPHLTHNTQYTSIIFTFTVVGLLAVLPILPLSMVDEVGSSKHRVSRTPSIREPLDREPSVARRSSLPSISQRPTFVISETSSEPPIRGSVHGETVDRFVEILVHGLRGLCFCC